MTTQTLKLKNLQKGFTLIELLIVIVIITALAVTVFVALNPVKRVKDAHDSRRAADVETILTSIHEYIVDNSGTPPTGLLNDGSMRMLCLSGACSAVGGGAAWKGAGVPGTYAGYQCGAALAAGLDLSTVLASYLKSIPSDPNTNSVLASSWNVANSSGYAVTMTAANIITVTSCFPENVTSISQSR